MTTLSALPFEYQSKKDFSRKLAEWISDVFYDILPQYGYEVREEQIYTALQMATAVCKEKVHFAEAGLGTGKTFAYLLTALAYARFKKKPAIIACASTALQEQLAGPEGDIEKLSTLLNLQIDIGMAKDPRQYVCDQKINQLYYESSPELSRLLEWAESSKRGERSEIPEVSDKIWAQVAWDEAMDCEACWQRGFCKLVKARENYRSAADLIICDHGLFFDDLWTREERLADGKLPLLPDYSAVIFDEGHKILLPAALKAGRQVVRDDIADMLLTVERVQGARSSLISAALAADGAAACFFKLLYDTATDDERTDRLTVQVSEKLLKSADVLRRTLDELLFQLQSEQELHTESLSPTQIQLFESRLERATVALSRFSRNKGRDVIFWAQREEQIFWVVPRNLRHLLKKHLFAKQIPVVFSSATLSTGGDFTYLARTFGLQDYSGSTVDGPFDYRQQAVIYLPQRFPEDEQEGGFAYAIKQLVSLLEMTKGRALVLTNAPSEVGKIRRALKAYQLPYEFLWEDSAERGYLVRRFKEVTSSVLVGANFWEGIDVPGEALSLLVVWQLPFPPLDPLIDARRREAKEQGQNPLTAVDYPEMGLKLKQGCGRLIRTRQDRGAIAILQPVLGKAWEKTVLDALPSGAKVMHNFEDFMQALDDYLDLT